MSLDRFWKSQKTVLKAILNSFSPFELLWSWSFPSLYYHQRTSASEARQNKSAKPKVTICCSEEMLEMFELGGMWASFWRQISIESFNNKVRRNFLLCIGSIPWYSMPHSSSIGLLSFSACCYARSFIARKLFLFVTRRVERSSLPSPLLDPSLNQVRWDHRPYERVRLEAWLR